ncbi:MAG: hypothetical protein MK142_12230 [Pseudomonadales bacterium]|nr:hypothetical protein [Pseudomonadales bacterium]
MHGLLLGLVLALSAYCAAIALGASQATLAARTTRAWVDAADVYRDGARVDHRLALAMRFDPWVSRYAEARGLLAQQRARYIPALRDAQLELAQASFLSALESSPSDGVLWAHHAALLMEQGAYADLSAPLAHAYRFAPFEPMAQRVITEQGWLAWPELDEESRMRVLAFSANGLLSVRPDTRAKVRAQLDRYGARGMVCSSLGSVASNAPDCMGQGDGRGAN